MPDHTRDRTLRLDKRLLRRRGWIDPEALERELASLPDVSAKAIVAEDPATEAGGDDGSPTPTGGDGPPPGN